MRISIITVCYNSVKTIESSIQSVLLQSHPDIEHIVLDGGSTDGTLNVIEKYRSKIAKIISEKDDGMYCAINRGVYLATGDIIGNLNSDDFYANRDVIKKIAERMGETGADVCWGDLVYVDRNNPNKIVRCWKSSDYDERKFRRGWMPPHPTFFVRRQIYEKYGLFNTDFKIAADYELMLRLLEKYKARSCYIPEVLVKMRTGGKTSKNLLNIVNILKYKAEDCRAWKINGLKVNPIAVIFLKSLSKVSQFRQ